MNASFEHIIENIIPSFLDGNASVEEITQLNEWLAKDEKNVVILESYTQIWNRSKNETSPLSANESWQNFEKKTNQKKGLIFSLRTMSVAASILVIVSLGFYFVKNNFSNKQLMYASNSKDSLKLEDGSMIYSSGNAVVEYPASFAKNTREVSQKSGIAFYEITKNPKRPFIIHNSIADIKVLGTSFKTTMNNDSVEVIVTTGKVKVYHDLDSVILLPTERIVFYKNNGHTEKLVNSDANYLYWKTNILQYQNERLEDVFKDIEQKFGCEINTQNQEINNLRINGKFKSDDINELLKNITATFELKLKNEKNIYTIS